ncbi:MAG: phospho-sugar mutase [Lactobacillaceae bacterium]|jgi:phosphoglucomutase|nr:phospho-sugar mutase [Lactobacillaceae bacterium]
MLNIEEKIQSWQDEKNLDAALKKELKKLDDEALRDAFYQDLSFGTAGMRGVLGVGTNRMNIYTVAQTTQALAEVIKKAGDDAVSRGVVISYDSRINSDVFASTAAGVLRANGITVHLFTSPHPTPELSFAVMELNTYAGIMITASHNPKEYNGYKLYGEDGGQLTSKPAAQIVKEREKITDIFNIKQIQTGIKKVPTSFDAKYLKRVAEVTVDKTQAKKAKDFQLVFTPLHGAGGELGLKALKQAGFKDVKVVEKQFEPNGKFPTVEYPNPEFHNVFELAQKQNKKADVLLAIDPDGDRMGVAYRANTNEWGYLTGNQIAALMVHYLLSAKQNAGALPTNGAIVTSIVSSNLPARIAKTFKVKAIDVLTGFKYIADQIVKFDEKKNREFLFGFEESYGFLVKPFVHDKDAIQAVTLMSELSAYYFNQGKTLGDALEEIFEEYGFTIEDTLSIDFPGESGKKEMDDMMNKFRSKGPSKIGDYQIQTVQDYELRVEKNLENGKTKKITLPQANVIKYLFEDGSWIALRPSGTEPKLKIYVGVVGDTLQAANQKLGEIQSHMEALLAR